MTHVQWLEQAAIYADRHGEEIRMFFHRDGIRVRAARDRGELLAFEMVTWAQLEQHGANAICGAIDEAMSKINRAAVA